MTSSGWKIGMAAPDMESRSRLGRGFRSTSGALVLLAVALLGCSSSPSADPEALPPQTATRHRSEPPPAAPTPSPTPSPTVTPAPTTIVIEPPHAEPAGETSLVEAARKERERRANAATPAVKLDNKNLQAFVGDQKLTVATPADGADPSGAEGATDADTVPEAGSAREEAYWRDGARAIRERWAFAVEDVKRLEGESADLRRQFYSEDDPYVRDQQIKPEWDRVLGELDRARREAAKAPDDLEAFLEEGRRAGALPGWLREGIELEPELPPEEASRLSPAEPREPVVVEKDPENP